MLTRSNRQPVPLRPTLECLEDRMLLSAAAVTGNDFLQVNLVANVAGVAANTDPNLILPTGISVGPSGPFWVSDSGANESTLYNTAGNPNALVVAIPGPNGSAPNVTTSPTGQINPAADGTIFLIPGTGPGHGVPAAFLFATADGTIAAWDGSLSPNTEAVTVVDDSGQGASFTGLASGTITTNGTANSFLYAADFRNGKIDVFDSSFNPVSPSASSPLAANAFQDSKIPPGFSPYNIRQLGGNLFVTYAKVGPDGKPDLGAGQGFVDEFTTTGKLIAHFQGQGSLDAPFGLALVPTSGTGFAQSRFAGDLLVANTGNGTIAAFNPANGHFVGLLNNAAGQPLMINGLRSLQFGNGNGGGTAGVLYFTADPTQGVGACKRAVRLAQLRAGNQGGRDGHGHPANRTRQERRQPGHAVEPPVAPGRGPDHAQPGRHQPRPVDPGPERFAGGADQCPDGQHGHHRPGDPVFCPQPTPGR